MSEVTKSQSRNPRAALAIKGLDTERYDYFPVQKSGPNFKNSPLADYFYTESLCHPGEPMYELVADGEKSFIERAQSGAADNVLLRIRKEDRQALMKEHDDEALRRARRVSKAPLTGADGKKYEATESISGGVLSSD